MIYRWMMVMIMILLCNKTYAEFQVRGQYHKRFISISDIHFDPTAGCERGKPSCGLLNDLVNTDYILWDSVFEKYNLSINYYDDTNYFLLKSLLIKLKMIADANNPQFVLILGDFLDHNLEAKFIKYSQNKTKTSYERFVIKTQQYLVHKFNQTFPHTDIYPVLGNVDTYGKDYSVIPKGNLLSDLSATWSVLIKNKSKQRYFLEEFSRGGYYAIDINESAKVVVLNTVLFSPKSQTKVVKKAAEKELLWLNTQLKVAQEKHQSVLIACHIPPGINLYLSSTMPYKIIKNFWVSSYTDQFIKLIKKYSDSMVGVLPGHVHIDLFQFTLKGANSSVIPMIFTPSVSPIFGNNPAIKIFNYQEKPLKLLNFERYYLPLNASPFEWRKGEGFNGIHQTKCKYCYLSDVVQHLIMNNYLLDVFLRYYSGIGDIESDDVGKFSYYWCSLYSNDIKTYKKCVSE